MRDEASYTVDVSMLGQGAYTCNYANLLWLHLASDVSIAKDGVKVQDSQFMHI